MKKLLTLIAAVFISINLFAQAPQKMSYQAVIRNSSNALVTNAPVKMRISILQASATGNAVYSELHSTTTNANGLVSIEIGGGTSPTGTFSSINWGNGTYFLKTETDPTNGSTYSIIGTSQLLSVPYAYFSKYSGSLEYPDGISDDIVYIHSDSKFKVPSGKSFYINYAQQGITIDQDTFDLFYPPVMIIQQGKEIGTLGGYIVGFLTNKGVTPINLNLKNGDYVVPNGRTFVLLAISEGYGSNSNFMNSFQVNNISPNPNNRQGFMDKPVLFGSGTKLSCNCSINGYLR